MSEHTRTGPYEDGTYRYRGWWLERWESCHELSRFLAIAIACRVAQPVWMAYPPHEVTLADFNRVWVAAGGGAYDSAKNITLARHEDGIPWGTIEEAIDLWEAGRERLFREAFAQAVREP